jgi:hypothetical protein
MGDPDFLLRGSSKDHVCGFHKGKPHELPRSRQDRQEIRAKPTTAFHSGPYRLFLRPEPSVVGDLQFFSPGTHTPS